MLNDSDLLNIIMTNLKKNDKYIIIKDENNNIIFPNKFKNLDEINQLKRMERIIFHRKSKEFYDEQKDNHYSIKINKNTFNNKTYTFEIVENINLLKKFEYKSNYDTTTKLLNKRAVLNELDSCIFNKDGSVKSLSIIIGDIDFFKNINDKYSHLAGDKALIKIANILKCNKDSNCLIGRFGGDEFVLIFKNQSLEKTIKKIERIRDEVKKLNIEFDDKIINNLTMSFGIYNINEYFNIKFNSMDDIVKLREKIFGYADKALYESKKNGRNKITVYSKKKNTK